MIPPQDCKRRHQFNSDTGTTGKFAAVSSAICINVQPVTQGVYVLLPNTSYMHLTHVGEIPLLNLPAAARKVHLFSNMGRALLAIPVLCDHGCQDIFDADGLVVKNKSTGRTVIMGIREKATGLWLVDIADQSNRSNATLVVPTEQPPQCCSSNSTLAVAEPVTLTSNSSIDRETMPE